MDGLPPIGIVATSGDVPLHLAHHLRGQGCDVVIISLANITTADFDGFPTFHHHIGGIGHIIDDLSKAGCRKVVLAGHLKRPPLKSIKPDLRGMKIFTKVMTSGDNAALGLIRDEFAKSDLEVVSINQIMPELRAEQGMISGRNVSDDAASSIKLGADVLRSTGAFDIGQGVVVQGQRVLALEGAEGTNGLLMRSAGLIDQDAGAAVFVKMMKTDQDQNLDPPGLGAKTIELAATAEISIIAVEAGRVIILNKHDVIAAAEHHNITIIGIDAKGNMAGGSKAKGNKTKDSMTHG